MSKLQEKADILKEDAKKLTIDKQEKQTLYNKLNTADMKLLQTERENLKEKIEILQKEKNDILYHNQEVEIKSKRVKDAKEKLNVYENVQKEILEQLELIKSQKRLLID